MPNKLTASLSMTG